MFENRYRRDFVTSGFVIIGSSMTVFGEIEISNLMVKDVQEY